MDAFKLTVRTARIARRIVVRTIALLAAFTVCVGPARSDTTDIPVGWDLIIQSLPPEVQFCFEGNTLTIFTTLDQTVVSYLQFDIASGQIVDFDQPGSLSQFLNFIDSADPSMLDGTITSNGIVYFVNPAGVVFGENAFVDVGGLYAAAANIEPNTFFETSPTFNVDETNGGVMIMGPGAGPGASINAQLINLVGNWVHNHGTINVENGGAMSMIAARGTIMIQQLGDRIAVTINGQNLDSNFAAGGNGQQGDIGTIGVLNSGTINAANGQVVLGAGDLFSMAILNDGMINAGGAGGSVQMQALGGTVSQTGDLVASELLTSGDLIALAGELHVGDAQFNDAVVLEGDVTISGTDAASSDDAADDVLFLSTVGSDGNGVNGLEIHAGTTSFEGAVGAGTTGDGDALSFLDITGDLIRLGGGAVTTTGVQNYRGAVELSLTDAFLTGSNILFTDDVWAFADDIGLTLNGDANFQGTVGWTDQFGGLDRPLSYLTANGAFTRIAGGGVRTVGNQQYFGQVELSVTDATLEGAQIDFYDDLWALTEDIGLTLDGNAAFNGAVGSTTEAGEFLLGRLEFLTANGDFTRIGGGSVRTVGNQTYNGRVELAGTSATLAGDEITFNDELWAFDDGIGLTLDGNTTFNGIVGATTLDGVAPDRPLAFLTANGTVSIAGGGVATVGVQSYHGGVELAGTDATLEGSQINFFDELWALTDDVGLTLDGDAAFFAAVGSTTQSGSLELRPLEFLAANGAFTRIAGGSVRTTGLQTYAGRVELLLNDVTLHGSEITFQDELWAFSSDIGLTLEGDAIFNNAVGSTTLFGDAVYRPLADLTANGDFLRIAGGSVATVGLQTYNAQVQLSGTDATLSGSNILFRDDVWALTDTVGLTLNGDTTFDGLVGAFATPGGDPTLRPLAFLAANGGQTRIVGGMVNTVGSQTYAGLVQVLTNDATLTGSDVVFMDDLWAFDPSLDLTIDGNAEFHAAVGMVAGLDRAFGDLRVTGATLMNGGLVRTVGAQTYEGAVTLGTDSMVAAGSVDFQSTVTGPHVLDIDTTGNASFADAVDVGGLEVDTGGTITAAGTIEADDAITMTATLGATFADAITAGGTLFVGTAANPAADVTFGGDLTASAVTTEVHGFLLFDGANVTATNGDVNLNTGVNLATVPAVATIGSTGDLSITVLNGGDFTMGDLQKLTVLGDLVVAGAGGGTIGTATLSDINTLGNMVVTATDIVLLAREPGLVLDGNGNLVLDLGLDFVAGGEFLFSTAPVVQGSGLVLFASTDAEGDALGTLQTFPMQAIGDLERGRLVLDEGLLAQRFLDLRSQGPTNDDVAEAIAAAIPRDDETSAIAPGTALSATVRDLLLNQLQIQPRTLTPAELNSLTEGRGLYSDAGDTVVSPASVGRQSVAITRLDFENTTRMADMLLGMLDDAAAVRADIADSWDRYTSTRGAGAYDIRDYVAYARRTDPATIARLRALNDCLDTLGRTGMTPTELIGPKQRVVEIFAPRSLGADGLRRVLDVMRAG